MPHPKSILFVLQLVIFSIVVVAAQYFAILVPFLSRKSRRRFHSYLESVWVDMTGALFPEVKLIVTGDDVTLNKPTVFIVNHQVDADWWFMWILGKAYKMHGNIKIILKASLKWIPLFGQGMKNLEFIFLQRNWAQDKNVLTSQLRTFVDDQYTFWVLLFPEGTTVHAEALEKGRAFAQKAGRPLTRAVLLPRVTGFEAVLRAAGSAIEEVHDVTMCYEGYSGDVPTWDDGYDRKRDKRLPNIAKMTRGVPIPPVHLYVTKHKVNAILEQGVEKWLDSRWVEKDELLQHFAAAGTLPAKAQAHRREVTDRGSLRPVLALLLLECLVVAAAAAAAMYLYRVVMGAAV